jgi:tryptophanyl-tRNA synthetase
MSQIDCDTKDEVINPQELTSCKVVDYMKLVDKFGCHIIDNTLLEKFEKVTGKKAHVWLKRNIYFSHQDLDTLLDLVADGKEIFIYTGRGPSSNSMHIGHLVPFMFAKYLQDAFNAIVIIQMSDDEKYYARDSVSLDECNKLAYENAKDIIACGFNPLKTFIFSNLETVGGSLFRNIVHLMKTTTGNQIKGAYGLNLSNPIGQITWPMFQIAPAFSSSFENIFHKKNVTALIPMGIDQAVYFRTARDFADKMKYPKPATIHSKFLPGLEGINTKMSSTSTNANSVIFLSDNAVTIKKKIGLSFSGGKNTLIEHRLLGADLSVDVAYQYLTYFLEDDDKFQQITTDYSSGIMTSGQIKQILVDLLVELVNTHKKNRDLIDAIVLRQFFDMTKNDL